MRYCALIGSTSSWTPRFSTQKSPSSILSSKVNPYWKPEQPPPETNSLNLRFGFASSRISSPTLPAAASVKANTSGGGGRSPWVIESDLALMGFFLPRRPPANQSSEPPLGLRFTCPSERPSRPPDPRNPSP